MPAGKKGEMVKIVDLEHCDEISSLDANERGGQKDEGESDEERSGQEYREDPVGQTV